MTDQTPTKWEGMSEAQAIVAGLQRELPDADLEQISDALVKVLNPKPVYSTLEKPALHTVKSVACGEFALGYYYDADRIDHNTKQKGTMMVALNKRPKIRGEFGGEERYACTGGGYMELGGENTPGEQPHEGAARELREETLDDQGNSVLNVAPDRMQVLVSGIDYDAPFGLPVHYSGYALELTKDEYEAMSKHAERLTTDEVYQKAVFEKTNSEVTGYKVMPLNDALELALEQWAYPHERQALHDLDAQLKQERGQQIGRA